MATYEGAWDCPSCGQARNPGPAKHCPACGFGRGPDVEIYLPQDAREVQSESELEKAAQGPDWSCAYCQVDNLASARFCVNCGAGQDGSAPRQVRDTLLQADGPPAPVKPGCLNKKRLLFGCVGLPLLLLIFLIWLATPRSADLEVVGHSWERIVQTEDYRQLEESGWEGSVPKDAEVMRSAREVHHVDKIQTGSVRRTRTVNERVQDGSERVKVGTRNKGNGYFEDIYENRPRYKNRSRQESYDEPVYRDQPVYRTKVYYKVWRWRPGSDQTAKGNDLEPRWPVFSSTRSRREKARVENYQVSLRDSRRRSCIYTTSSESEWRRYQQGSVYHGKVLGEKCVELSPGP